MQITIEQKGDETIVSSPEGGFKEIQIIPQVEARTILTVTELGFGKRTNVEDWRCQKRGGRGVPAMNCTKKTGGIVGALLVMPDQDVMVCTKQDQVIRIPASNVSITGRKTQGVKLINLAKGDTVTSITVVPSEEAESNA